MIEPQLPICRPVLVEEVAHRVLLLAEDPIAPGQIRFAQDGLGVAPGPVQGDLHIQDKG